MIEVGKWQTLKMIRSKDFGVYLGAQEEPEETVLLPRKQVPEALKTGDEIEVFIYRDSQDRKIATINQPRLTAGEIGSLKVVSVSNIGAFMDCGLERDILLPFKEQTTQVVVGKEYPVYMYVDKSERLCVTMRLYSHLDLQPPYQKDDSFQGVVYEYKEHMGAFVVVDGRYSGLIPKNEIFHRIEAGDKVEGRILNVREDGKMDLSVRRPAHLQMDVDCDIIMQRLEELNGVLPFTDKAAPERIKQEFGMSKNEFKRAVGRLLKEGKAEITGQEIRKK
ncbi:MAG: S1-like domain-containing RNA-binding protein [Bacteroides sp.]|nr:S1-like domain-containing RNA-binding protein [Bacteroides sp.]MCM1548343.1 S1-like domain-containing RNA-binding protein [Clostridium sp.]